MNPFRVLIRFIPHSMKQSLYLKIRNSITNFKQPKMLWGYRNSDGRWQQKTRISDTVFMYHPEKINISDNVFIGHYCVLDGTGGLEIGEGTQISHFSGIITHSSHIAIRLYGKHYQNILEYDKKGYQIGKVVIGKYVFVGVGSKILPGVTIGDGALIAAGAIVNNNVESFKIVAGNPAKVIGDTRELDAKYLEDPQLKEWYYEWQKK